MREDGAARLAVRRANPMDEAMIDMLADRMADFPVPPWRTRGEIADGYHPMLRAAVHERGDGGVLLVAHRAEGRGVAGRLLQAAEEWARGQGLRTLVCQAFEDNWRGLAFYEHQGFRRDTVRLVKAL